jgi:hypothetical protein
MLCTKIVNPASTRKTELDSLARIQNFLILNLTGVRTLNIAKCKIVGIGFMCEIETFK